MRLLSTERWLYPASSAGDDSPAKASAPSDVPYHYPSRSGIPGATKNQPVCTGWLIAYRISPEISGKQVDRTRLFDGVGDSAVKFGGNSGHAARQDFAGLGGELGEQFRVGGNDLIRRNVVTAARHLPVGLAEVDTTLNCFWLGHGKIQ